MAKRAAGELILAGLRWWRSELAEMLPSAHRRAGNGRRDVLLLEVGDARIRALRCVDGKCQELASVASPAGVAPTAAQAALTAGEHDFGDLAGVIDPEITPVVVRVCPREVLTRTISLPLAAAENLRQVLAFEMHRRTPFAAADVYFDFRRLPGRPGDQRLRVQLSVVRRRLIDAALALLPPWDLRVAGMTEIPGIETEGLLLRLTRPNGKPSSSRALTRVLWAANAALLAAVVAIPLLHQGRQIDALRHQVAAAKAEAESVAALRQQAEKLRADRRSLIDAKRNRPAFATLLSELTAALPDSTWVQRLEIKSRRVRLHGTSATASSLIPIIEDSRLFREAAFNAPVTRNPATGKEQFQLTFEITSPTDVDEDDNGQNLQKSAGSIAATGRLHRLR
jgi:general secretion pathway protein L